MKITAQIRHKNPLAVIKKTGKYKSAQQTGIKRFFVKIISFQQSFIVFSLIVLTAN